jgi:hypothetical protein
MLDQLKNLFREWLGERLTDWALRILPTFHSGRTGMMRGLREQREYERYLGYTLMLNELPMGFDRWREIHASMRVIKRGFPGHVPSEAA